MSQQLETISGAGAILGGGSPDEPPSAYLYRYRLWRPVEGNDGTEPVLFIMLNPSTADHTVDDPTIRRCAGFARRFGSGRLEVANLFALRATNPRMLDEAEDPVGEESDRHILDAAETSELVVCAWGAKIPRGYEWRARQVLELLRLAGHPTLYCLGETKAGHPRHPLYLAKETPLEAYAK